MADLEAYAEEILLVVDFGGKVSECSGYNLIEVKAGDCMGYGIEPRKQQHYD